MMLVVYIFTGNWNCPSYYNTDKLGINKRVVTMEKYTTVPDANFKKFAVTCVKDQ